MARKAETAVGAGIKVLCHGQYYYKTATEKGAKGFDIPVMAPSLEMFRETALKYTGTDDKGKAQYRESSFINIRGQLKRRLLPILLAKKFVDFARVRFVVIDEIVSMDGSELDLPINLRSRDQLAEMIRKENIPIDVRDYLEIDDIRTDVLEYIESPESFLRSKERKDRRRSEDREFARMNNLELGVLPPVKARVEKPVAGIDSL